MGMTLEDVKQRIEEDKVEFLAWQYCTLHGEVKEVLTPVRDLTSVVENGCGIDGSCAGYVPTNESDILLRPDLDTYMVQPWGTAEDKTARMMCDLYQVDGTTPFARDPRGALKNVLRRMQAQCGAHWQFMTAPEMEYYLVKKDETGAVEPLDTGYYCDAYPRDLGYDFRKKMSRILDSLGFVCETNHHEGVQTKHEINFKYGQALSTADATITFKQVIKHFAAREGLTASFMPKPFYGHHGAGMHIHMSIFDAEAKKNLFYDPAAEHQLSETGRWFMAGIMNHARGLAGITNPSVNSYKRLVPGFEAPIYVCWGLYNRSVMLRVPVSTPEARRVEIRCPDATGTPYLTFAALLAAGLDGIAQKMELPPAVSEIVYHLSAEERRARHIPNLPGNLKEALHCLEADTYLQEALGQDLVHRFLELKWKQWDAYSQRVHPWELETYLDV
ncbi:MAG: type I glutamate--ammonia ligase [Desulfobacteraceae bacterium]|jgi:glutamine synthetase